MPESDIVAYFKTKLPNKMDRITDLNSFELKLKFYEKSRKINVHIIRIAFIFFSQLVSGALLNKLQIRKPNNVDIFVPRARHTHPEFFLFLVTPTFGTYIENDTSWPDEFTMLI